MNISSYCKITGEGVNLNGQTVFGEHCAGEASSYFDKILKYFNVVYPKFAKMDAMSKLGFLTSEILLNALPHVKSEYSPFDCGILTTNSLSSLNTDLKYIESTKQIPSPSLFVYTLPNTVNAEICIRNNFKGENMFFVARDFFSSGIVEYADALFKAKIVKFCLCGQVEILNDNFRSMYFAVEEKQSETGEFSYKNIEQLI